MNERIRELLNEATVGLEPDLSPQRTVTLNEMAKFAELIVRECIETMYNTEQMNVAKFVALTLQEHFGLEE